MTIKSAKAMVQDANAVIETISIDQAKELLGRPDVQFVDVRETVEWNQGHLPGAVHVSRGMLEFLADPAMPTHKAELHSDKKLVLYCGSGGRSALAAQTLTDMGFTNLCHMAGGYGAWHQAGLPTRHET